VTRRRRPVAAWGPVSGGSVAGGSVAGGGVSGGSVAGGSVAGGGVSGGYVSRTGRVSSGTAVPCGPRARWRVGRIARRHRTARPDGPAGSAGSHAAGARGITGVLPRTRSAGREGLAARRAVAARHRVARPRRLARTSVRVGWRGGRRLAARAGWHPAGTSAWVHSRRVAGARRLRSGPARRRPFLAAPAGVSPGNRPSGSRTGSRGTQDLRDVLAVWHSGRAAFPGRVDEPAG
jgi:hypothetical protein